MKASRNRLLLTPEFAKQISELHPQIKRRARLALAQILANPHAGKPLQQELAGIWSLRTGRYRMIYRPRPQRVVEVIAFGPRRTIYEEAKRLLTRAVPRENK